MRKSYNMYSGTKKIGTFSLIDSGRKKEVTLIDGLTNLTELPIHFWNEYQEGLRVFDTKAVDYWINDRVIPSGRQDIDEILRGMELAEYSELGIFMYHRGRCVMDHFYIKDSSGEEHYKV